MFDDFINAENTGKNFKKMFHNSSGAKKKVSTVYRFKDIENINAMYREFCSLQSSGWKQSSRAPDHVCPCICGENMHQPQSQESHPGRTTTSLHCSIRFQIPLPFHWQGFLKRKNEKKRKENKRNPLPAPLVGV